MLLKLRYLIVLSIGIILSKISLNKGIKRNINGKLFYIKRRRPCTTPLIMMGNFLLRTSRAKVHVLQNFKWLEWSCQIYKEVLNLEVQTDNYKRLILPNLEGIILSALLKSNDKDILLKLKIIGLATRSLEKLHQCQVTWPDGEKRLFSHGDATAANVICDVKSGSCIWCDFDTIHDDNMPSAWRHSDDLRAIIYSAAKYLGWDVLNSLGRVTIENYHNRGVLEQLKQSIEMLQQHPKIYHLAQSKLGFQKRIRLNSILLYELEKVLITQLYDCV